MKGFSLKMCNFVAENDNNMTKKNENDLKLQDFPEEETLEELNYSIHYQVMDGQTYVPQHRERIMIVGFDRERYHGEEQFTFPEQHEATRAIREILDPNIDPKYKIAA